MKLKTKYIHFRWCNTAIRIINSILTSMNTDAVPILKLCSQYSLVVRASAKGSYLVLTWLVATVPDKHNTGEKADRNRATQSR